MAKRVAFLHPDLGLGGAERLIVDAAAGLAHQGHSVVIYTSHYEASRSFAETRDGSFAVQVYGDWIPRHVAGKFHILFAVLRNLWLALRVSLLPAHDVFIVDQVSASVPVLRLLRPAAGIVFYCHFPDQLLSIRRSVLKQLYRLPFDLFEQCTTGLADRIVVNSNFTRQVFASTFRMLEAANPAVLYPCVAVDPAYAPGTPSAQPVLFVSINRYERKKAIELAIEGLASLKTRVSAADYAKLHLVIAGGYDPRVSENVEYHQELVKLATERGLVGSGGFASDAAAVSRVLPGWPSSDKGAAQHPLQVGQSITFIRSFSDDQKAYLLRASSAVLYTPTNEHFGIVPLECMAAVRPVIACASGGPLESIEHGRTGWLCQPEADAFAAAMEKVVRKPQEAATMGIQGRQRVIAKFSREAFARDLDATCKSAAAAPASRRWSLTGLFFWAVSMVPLWTLLALLCASYLLANKVVASTAAV